MTRYRIVCADGTVSHYANDERMARIYAAYDDRSLDCGPHHVEEITEGADQ